MIREVLKRELGNRDGPAEKSEPGEKGCKGSSSRSPLRPYYCSHYLASGIAETQHFDDHLFVTSSVSRVCPFDGTARRDAVRTEYVHAQ